MEAQAAGVARAVRGKMQQPKMPQPDEAVMAG